MARKSAKENWLVFVDTNILLDFYRLGGESADRQLKALEKHKDSIITSDQVRMEFLKNRQKVIAESMRQLKKPDAISLPPIVSTYQPSKMLAKHLGGAATEHKKIRSRIDKILANPAQNDPVYQSLSKIFDHKTPFNLTRPNKVRFQIRHLARKRFILGYPPRKNNDTSIGDAVNWEWVVHCAINSNANHHVLIVSRDGDYGTPYDNDAIINDWLAREFKERVSRKRRVELTTKLTVALKRLDERVTPEDESEEAKLLASSRETKRLARLLTNSLEAADKQDNRLFLRDILVERDLRRANGDSDE